MRSLIRLSAVVLSALVSSAGCAPYALVQPTRTRIGDGYSVEPQIGWTSLTQPGRTELWTADGPALESLQFVKDVADGQTLFGQTIITPGPATHETPEDRQPRFRATMTPSEIVELVTDTWALLGASKTDVTGLRPAKFGSADGFRFDLTFVWSDGVEGRAIVAGAVVKQRLQVIVYSGTRLHYFEKHRPTVERLIDSVRLE